MASQDITRYTLIHIEEPFLMKRLVDFGSYMTNISTNTMMMCRSSSSMILPVVQNDYGVSSHQIHLRIMK